MTDASTHVKKRRLSAVWVVPIAAAILGVWMVIHTLQTQGPKITIQFATAEGIEPGKTKIKMRNVEIGLVEEVGFGAGWEAVEVIARLDLSAKPLLREDTDFWTVRPRVGAQGVSGIGTLLSGAYIQLEPGEGAPGRRKFIGLELPPVTPAGVPGLHLVLESEEARSVDAGDPVLYRGFTVGRIESSEFNVDLQKMHYKVFVEAPYDDLVTTSTRFWDVSGIRFRATAQGIRLATPALDTVLRGGVAFAVPKDFARGKPAEANAIYDLYPDEESVATKRYRFSIHYVLEFEESVRGLLPGAPVEFRGVPVGVVERVMLQELSKQRRRGVIPVLIRVEPARASFPDTAESIERFTERVVQGVAVGLRASLVTGNLLTGSRYVILDYHPDPEPASMGTFSDRPTIPTVPGGLGGIQQQVSAFLTKLNDLPLENVAEATERAIEELAQLLESEETQGLPASLEATMADTRRTLRGVSPDSVFHDRLLGSLSELDRALVSLRTLLETLDDQPNSLIFDRKANPDLVPPAGRP